MAIHAEGRIWHTSRNRHQKTLVYGVHPNDIRTPKKEYAYWCSDYLYIMDVQPNDLIVTNEKNQGRVICVTKVIYWNDGDFEPTRMAKKFYEGEKYKDFSID